MKKTLTHNGLNFNLELKLNNNVERRMNGKVEHLLSAYGAEQSNSFNKSWMIDNSKMKEQLEEAEQEIKDFADGKKLSPEEEIAALFGFKK